MPHLSDLNYHISFKHDKKPQSVLFGNEFRFDFENLNSWLLYVLEKEPVETTCGDFLVEIILLLIKCFQMRLYRTFDESKQLLLSLMAKVQSCRLEGVVFEKCLILFCQLFNLEYELQIEGAMHKVLSSFVKEENCESGQIWREFLLSEAKDDQELKKTEPYCEIEQMVTEKVEEMGIVNIFDTLPIWKFLTNFESEPLWDQVSALKKNIKGKAIKESNLRNDSEYDDEVRVLVLNLSKNDKLLLCDDKIQHTIMKTIVRCGMPFSTVLWRCRNINFLDESELSTHLYVSQSLVTIWNLQWDMRHEDSQYKIAVILDEFASRCCGCDYTIPTQMKPNNQNQRIFQKLSAHIYILQLLDNYIDYSYNGSFDVRANIQRCYTFLSYFCLDFTENQSSLHEHLQRLLRQLERYPCAEAVYVIALMFKDQEVCLKENIIPVMNALSSQMLRAKDKNAVHILSRLSRIKGNATLRAKHVISRFISERKHDLFALLSFQEIENFSQKIFKDCDEEALMHVEYHTAIIKLVTSYSEVNIGFIKENYEYLLSWENILSLLGSPDIFFEIKLSYFNLLRKSYLCHHSYISTILNENRLWKFVTWSWILFRGSYKSDFSEHVSLRSLITSSFTPFMRKLFHQWQENLSCFQEDRQIVLNDFKRSLDLHNFGASSFESKPTMDHRAELIDKCRSFTRTFYTGDNTTEWSNGLFGQNRPTEGKSKHINYLKEYIELHNLMSDVRLYISEQSLNGTFRIEAGEINTPLGTQQGPINKNHFSDTCSLDNRLESLLDNILEQDSTKNRLNNHIQLFLSAKPNGRRLKDRILDEKRWMLPYLLYDFKLTDGLTEIENLKEAICYLQRTSERFIYLSTVEQLNEINVVKFTLASLRHVAQLAFGKLSEESVTHLRKKNYTKYKNYISRRKEVQEEFVKIGAVEMILSLLSLRQPHIFKQSLKHLCCLLEAGNSLCQARFFKLVANNPNPQFFSDIHSFIQNSRDLLNEQTLTSDVDVSDRIDIEVLTLVFRVLQLLCEGHNYMAQTYLLRQVEKAKEFDIVNATLDFWKELIDPKKKKIYQTKEFFPLNIQLLNTIIEYSQGCIDVQKELCERNVVECIMDIFNYKPEIHKADELKLTAGTLLLSLLEGPKGSPGDQIAKEISSDRFKINVIKEQLNTPYSLLDDDLQFPIASGTGLDYFKWVIEQSIQHRDLGSTLYCILLYLKPYVPSSYFMDELTEKSMNHYSEFVKSIEIVRPIQNRNVVERVFFPLPCSSHYLTSKVKIHVRRHINRSSMKMKLEDFLLSADKLMIHIKNQKLLEKKIPLFRFLSEDVCWMLAYLVIVILNAQLLSSDFSIDGLSMLYLILWSILTLMYLLRNVMVKFKIAYYERNRRVSHGQRYEQHQNDNRNKLYPILDEDHLYRIIRLLVDPSSSCLTKLIFKFLLRKAFESPQFKNNGFRLAARRTAIEFLLNCAEHTFLDAFSRAKLKLGTFILQKTEQVDFGRKRKQDINFNLRKTMIFYLSLLCIPFTDLGLLYHISILILVMIARSFSNLYFLIGFPLLDIVYRIQILRDILKAVAHSGNMTLIPGEIYDS
jgi:hypothetical protein